MNKLFLLAFSIMKAFGAADDRLTKNTPVLFQEYQSACRCYEVAVEENVALGPFYTTPEWMHQALPELDLARIERSPASILHTRFVLDKNLLMLTEQEKAARERGAAPKP